MIGKEQRNKRRKKKNTSNTTDNKTNSTPGQDRITVIYPSKISIIPIAFDTILVAQYISKFHKSLGKMYMYLYLKSKHYMFIVGFFLSSDKSYELTKDNN